MKTMETLVPMDRKNSLACSVDFFTNIPKDINQR
jgi:hypothetical protein